MSTIVTSLKKDGVTWNFLCPSRYIDIDTVFLSCNVWFIFIIFFSFSSSGGDILKGGNNM